MPGRRLVISALILLAGAAPALCVPPGFSDTIIVDNIASPTAIAFTPDGRMIVTTQDGEIRVYQQNGTLLALALDIPLVCAGNSEMGLLGVAVDPAFATPGNNFIYVYYSSTIGGSCKNRVSRYTLPTSNIIDPASQLILMTNIPARDGHNAGDVNFGPDGYLYISIGDALDDHAVRTPNVVTGRIHRITKTGLIPPTNPFQGANSERCYLTGIAAPGNWCRETYAWGFRNPFRFAFDGDAPGTRFFVNDVGQNDWEEIDEFVLGQTMAGPDYGWNCREGAHPYGGAGGACSPTPPNMRDPIFEYNHGTGCVAITGGAFVPNGVWPAAYDQDYMYGDYGCGKIFSLRPNGTGGYTSIEFATNLGFSSAVHMEFGPFGSTQALYYTTYAGGGEVRRINHSSTNSPPTAVMTANPTDGPAPLTVNFDGSGSSDPNPGDTLTFIWNFGDGSPQPPSSPTVSHTYALGTFTATLRVQDNQGAQSNPVSRIINSGNTPPTPTITAPTPGDRFRVGQAVTLVGSATDAQDGTLPPSALSWTVLRRHAQHTHPFLGPVTGNNIPLTAPAPEDFLAASNSHLEIYLTATDSNGGSTTITQNFMPNTVNLTFATNPAGLRVTADSFPFTGPSTVVSWEAYVVNLNAPPQVDGGGNGWAWSSWSDGGAQSHDITTPPTPATYTATFVSTPVLTVTNPTLAEGNSGTSNATFTVTLSNTPSQTVAMSYSTADGTATAGTDYTAASGNLSFTTASSQTVNVSVNGDRAFEGNETLFFSLSNVVGAAVAGPGVGTIRQDDLQGADFNNDGSTDLLWRHDVSGQNVVWHMSGAAMTSGTFTNPSTLTDMNWKAVGTSHYDADGKTDILWRHQVSGQNVIWFMDGVNLLSGTFTTPSALTDTNWKAVATGDFNSDGKADILWRHAVSGQNVVWLMNGSVLASGTFLPTLTDLNWKMAGSGDFNSDGKTDIVFSHAVSGQIVVWYMDGTTFAGGEFTNPGALSDTNWRLVGVGDFNVDAKSDLLWRHAVSGQNVVWFMDGSTLQGGTFTTPSTLADLNWKIVGPR